MIVVIGVVSGIPSRITVCPKELPSRAAPSLAIKTSGFILTMVDAKGFQEHLLKLHCMVS